MKDFGYYKNIINQHYNPEKKTLTKEKFYDIKRKIIAGDKKSEDELYELTCFCMYDLIAHAYAEGLFGGNFEDALQNAALKLYEMKIGKVETIYGNNFFSHISIGQSFKGFIEDVSSVVMLDLHKRQDAEKEQPIQPQQSHEINQLLQNPEDVAITNLIRPRLVEIVDQSGKRKKATRHKKWIHERIFDGFTLKEIAEDDGVVPQTVHLACSQSERGLKNRNRDELNELLH